MNFQDEHRFQFAIDFVNDRLKEVIYNGVVKPLEFDEINSESGNLWYATNYLISKNRVDKYLIKIYINTDAIQNSFSKVYPLRHLGGMTYCPLDLNESQIDIGLLVFKEQVQEEIEHQICIPEIPPMPEWMPRLHRD
jgi:hypothetical protein